MFRHKTRDIITLFHKPSLQTSTRVQTLLKQLSAAAGETATTDQASNHDEHSKIQRSEFDLEITEQPPTPDQLRSIIEYVGQSNISKLFKSTSSEADAMKKLSESGDNFQRPVVVDWNNGKAVVGANESEILKMLNLEKGS